MSQSLAVAIAEKVKDLFNAGVLAGDFSQSFRVERRYRPRIDMRSGELDDVLVIVTPSRERTCERETLNSWSDAHTITIGVNRKAGDADNATLDPLMLLAEEVCNYTDLEQFSLTGGKVVQLTDREQPLTYDEDWLYQNKSFFSAITLGFYVSRSVSLS